ncbi:MAG TPA: DUF4384 domain-containing protein [Burkholderiaceae bacterium]|nr:DUF4384 domain-containing protein [Burkholderiaceae bacterium]
MKRSPRNPFRRLLLAVAIGAAMTGCATLDPKVETVNKTADIKQAPESAPHRSITNFSSALKCMDNLMIDYGVRDVSVMVEDILDQTKKVNAGTKDMLISAVSDMTKRSRAIRLVAFGQDSNNVIAFLQQAGRKSQYEVIPEFDIKGSITQLDENLIKSGRDLGAGFGRYFNIGVSKDAASNMIGLDLTVLSTDDFSVISGVTSRNSVIIFKEGQGLDGDAAIKKFGISFNMTLNRSEGQSQALRNLVELAVIELFGKLTKTPYWTCLGSDGNNEEVKNEVQDWYYGMASNPSELVAYFQRQMRVRRVYNGPVDGVPNPEVKEAVARYREVLGLSREEKIDPDFFAAYLRADHRVLASKVEPVIATSPAPGAPPAPAVAAKGPAAAPSVMVLSSDNVPTFKRGSLVNLVVKPSRDAHVYCYLRDENAQIQRFYPNRFKKDSLVPASTQLDLPGKMRFQIVANNKGVREQIACFATERDVLSELPAEVRGGDFETLPVKSLDQVKQAFAATTRNNFGEGYFNVEVR